MVYRSRDRIMTHVTGTLSGIVVLDLSGYIAGPYACTLLADLGADEPEIAALRAKRVI